MLRKIRLTFAMICFALITLLFLDFTGTLHGWFGWLAKIQFLPAVLALNVGVILFLVILTLVCGRIYCSVICPLGVFQDILAWLGRQPKKRRKLPYSYSPALSWLRYGVLGVFIIALIAGIGSLAALLAPYSAYGRIANNLFQPIWQWGNNLLAYLAERADSYAFYETDVWLKSLPTFIIAAATLAVLVVLAGRNGRTYSNRYSIKWPQQVLNRVPYHSHTEKSSKKESISIYVFVKHSKSSRNTICWRLPSARWHTTIWSLPPAATQIILETTGWRNRPWH